jgi:type I restriction enzyme S subunit
MAMADGWPSLKLGELMDLALSKAQVHPCEEYPMLGVLNRGRGVLRREPLMGSKTKYRELHRIDRGMVVYSKLKAFEGAVTVALEGEFPAFASPEFPTFLCRPRLSPEFFALVTQLPTFWSELALRSTGMGGRRERVSPRQFLEIPLPTPPLEAQRRIVGLIGAVDEHVLRLEQEQQALDRLWWSVAAALESATSSVASMPLGQLAEISGGLTKNKNTALVGVPVVVPYLRVANVHRRFLDLADLATITTTTDVVERLRLRPGDVLLNEGGDKDKLGRGAVWSGQVENCIHQNHVFRARITDDRFNAEFVSAWANSFGQRWFETYGTQTTGIASISKTTLSKFPVPVLPKAEQKRWAAALDGVFALMNRLAAEADVLRALRARILDGLLSREVEIPESYDDVLAGVA